MSSVTLHVHSMHLPRQPNRACHTPPVRAGGVVVGFVFGVATRILFKLMHRRGHKAPEQLALTVAMAYLCFYVANAPCMAPLTSQ